MDITNALNNFWRSYGAGILDFLIAVAFLIAFYIVARIVRTIIRKGLKKTSLDNRFVHAVGLKQDFPIESVLGNIGFWLVMLFGLVTFFERLDLEMVATPINELLKEIALFLPKIGAAVGLLLLAWILASLVKIGINKLSDASNIDQRLNSFEDDGDDAVSVGESLATAGYWFVFLLFLPLVLSALQMESLVAPLQVMLGKLFSFLPNILSCVLIFIIGSFVAKIVRKVVTGLLAASGIDHITAKAGVKQNISKIIGTVVSTIILLLVITQALDALQIAAISEPAKQMISIIFTAIPGVFAAVVVIGVSYYVGRLIADLVDDLLASVGFNSLGEKLGIGESVVVNRVQPSRVVAILIHALVIMFALLGAAELIGFAPLTHIIDELIQFVVQVALGAFILSVGLFIANTVRDFIVRSGGAEFTAGLAKVAIITLALAMALRQIGLAEDIVNMAFAIVLGALGIGAAIAIGLGSKDVAGREVEALVQRFKAK